MHLKQFSDDCEGTGKFRKKRKGGDHLHSNIIKIGNDTGTISGDMKRLTVTQNSCEKHPTSTGSKNPQIIIIINKPRTVCCIDI